MMQDFVSATSSRLNLSHKKAASSSVQASKIICHDISSKQRNPHGLIAVKKDGQDFMLVPARLVNHKLTRYFTRTSKAVVAMSCCKGTQLHRKCLQDTFHADQSGSSDQCPGCLKHVTRSIFAQSNACYVIPDHRKKNCDACHQALGWRPVLKK